MSAHGKKYVVIPQEEYELLKSKNLPNNTLHNPMKQDLRRAEQSMKETLTNALPPDEKVRLFTEELNNMKRRYDDLTKTKPIRVVMDKKGDSEESEKIKDDGSNSFLSEALLKTIPKQSRTEAKLLFEHLQNHPEIIKWNKRGEISFKGDELNGSNLIDLIANVMTNRKSSGSLLHDTIFLKALSETNVPESWIKNRTSRKLLQSYKDVKELNPFTTPSSERKKIKIDWASST